MDKTQDAFRTIGEVAEELDLPQHVLRFWETKFNQIRPVKRAGGRRYYRPEDVQLVSAIRVLLHSEGYTIKGVQRILREQGARAVVAASHGGRGHHGSGSVTPLHLVPPAPFSSRMEGLLDTGPAAPRHSGLAAAPPPSVQTMPDLLTPLEAPIIAAAAARGPGRATEDSAFQGSSLSAQDLHRLETILVDLDECARLLEAARRR
ncbi:MerR family transcriptional regulator [uncultured Rhodoblastus sp.]|uniref:MerR family transcriptional regulator n=1 Tax=uncultured Rhodoblastus sp. TaxID=543037 RepID=UPI0025DCD215|nr:MerR family transcriptional regulator [uncultured Rhodoblastus sp.]